MFWIIEFNDGPLKQWSGAETHRWHGWTEMGDAEIYTYCMKCLCIDHIPVFSFQTAQDNIDLQTTILSRFDLIFIVKDIRMYGQDKV